MTKNVPTTMSVPTDTSRPRARAAIGQGWVLLAIWTVALILRGMLSQTYRVVWGDEPFYLWLGRNWITGQGYSFTGHPDVHHVPLYPWLAGLLYLITHDLKLASETLYTLFGSLLVFPLYGIGKELYGRRAGWIAAALAAVCPALTGAVLHWGSLTEPIYMFFVYAGIWALIQALRPVALPNDDQALDRARREWRPYALGGLSFGLAYLTRPEAIGYFAVGGVFVVLARLVYRRWDRRFWLSLLVYVLAFGVTFAPYAFYTRQHTGTWMVSQKVGVTYLTGIGLAHGDTGAFDRSTWGLDSTGLETFFFSSESYTVSMLEVILADPQTFVNLLMTNVIRFGQVLFDWVLFPVILTPFLLLGLLGEGWSRKRGVNELYLLSSIAPVAAFTLFFIQARYLVALVPLMLLWTACGLEHFSAWLIDTLTNLRDATDIPAGWRTAARLAPLAATLALLLWAQPKVLRQVQDVGSVRPEHRTVGEWLAGVVSPDEVIMSRYPAIAFHASARWTPTPNASWPEVLRYARYKGAHYWAIDERELRLRPQFTGLVNVVETPPELRLIHVSSAGGERLVVYEFLP